MFLTDFAEVPAQRDLADPAEASRFVAEVWEHPKVALWGIPPQPPPLPEGLDAAGAYRFALEAPFRAYAARFGKERWGDKTPHYVHHVDQILGVWPDARFVILVRDGRDVALSVARMPFGPNNAWAAASWWARGIRAGERAQAAHPDHVRTVRYEDLASRPRELVPPICEFLGLAFEEEMLALERADRSRVVADQRGWFPTLFDGIHGKALGRWRSEMSRRDQELFVELAGAELERHGYDMGGVRGRVPSEWERRRLHWSNQARRQVNFFRLRVVQERGRELRWARARRREERRRAQAATR
jgi:hypothetical protein